MRKGYVIDMYVFPLLQLSLFLTYFISFVYTVTLFQTLLIYYLFIFIIPRSILLSLPSRRASVVSVGQIIPIHISILVAEI